MKSISLFNHKGGVSKTTTAFNLSWSLSQKGLKVLMVDVDSQCNLTGLVLNNLFNDEEKLQTFYQDRDNITMLPIIETLLSGNNASAFVDNLPGKLLEVQNNLFLLAGHLDISELDSQISVALKVSAGIKAIRNIPGNLPKIINTLANKNNIDYIIYDLSPNVGGLNEVVLMSSDYFITPATPDFFSYQAVQSLTKHFLKWHREIERFKEENDFNYKSYDIKNQPIFLGIIQQKYRPYSNKPAKNFEFWINKIREETNQNLVVNLSKIKCAISLKDFKKNVKGFKPYDLMQIPDFNSLIAISQQLGKPVFAITDDELKKLYKGQTFNTMQENRGRFLEIFQDLANYVVGLTK